MKTIWACAFVLASSVGSVALADNDTPWGSPMTGPFSSPDELCGGTKVCGEGTRAQGKCGAPSLRGSLAPYAVVDEVRVLTVDCRFPDAKSGYLVPRLIARTRAGWFASDPFARGIHEQTGCVDRISVLENAARNVDDTLENELVVRLRVETTCGQGKSAPKQTSDSLIVVGSPGSDGVPRATPPVLLKHTAKSKTAQLEARFEGGALVIEPVTTEQLPETRATIGRHPLTLRGSATPPARR